MPDDPVTARIGFYGKLPSRGDFVRAGLSRALVSAWDAWLERVWPAVVGRGDVADAATARGRSATVGWRLALGPGMCGPDAVSGVLLPSLDRVGRRFPLLLALEGATADAVLLDAMEQAGTGAIRDAHEPDRLARALDGLPVPARTGQAEWPGRTRWWREGAQGEDMARDGWPDTFPPFL